MEKNKVVSDVWQVVRDFNRAFAQNDVERYFTYLSEDITVLTPANPYRVEGLAADREEFEFSLRTGSTRIGYFQELQPHVQVHRDAAVVTYFSRGSYGEGERAKVLYLKETDVLARRDGKWKIVHIHVSATH